MPSSKLRLYSLPLLSALALAAGCGRGEAPPPPAAAAPSAKHVDAATAATITGRVLYEGPAPQNPVVNTGQRSGLRPRAPGGNDARSGDRRQRRPRQRLRLHQGRARQRITSTRPTEPVVARSEGLPLHAARVRPARRPAGRDRQQRPDAAQRARACRRPTRSSTCRSRMRASSTRRRSPRRK